MPEETTTFTCLRCGARFPLPFDPKVVRERTCPQCGSNSVRRDTPEARAARGRREATRKGP